MNRTTRAALRLVVVSVISATSSLLPAKVYAQAGDSAFKQGMEARGDNKWADVITHMRGAIAADPTDVTRKVQLGSGFLGLKRRDAEYLPHYYLGEALYRTGDCVGAIEQWEISEGQGAIRKLPDVLRDLQDGYRQCERRGILPPPEYAAARQAAQQAVEQADAVEKRVAGFLQTNPNLARTDVNDSLDGARKEITAARSRLSAAEKGRLKTDFNEARSSAEHARGTLVSLESTLTVRLKEGTAATNQLAAEVDKAIGSAREIDRAIDATNFPLTPELRSARQASRDQLDSATGRLENGRKAQSQSQPILIEARNSANEAARGLGQVLAEVKRLLQEAEAREVAARIQKMLENAIAAARNAVSFAEASLARLLDRMQRRPEPPTAEMMNQRDEFQKRVTDLRPRLDRENEAKNIVGIQTVTRSANSVRARLDELTASFGPVTIEEQVGTALYTAAQSFMDGDYDTTIKKLDSSSEPAGGPLQAHVHLFRAASLFALYVRSGEKDQALLTRANGEIERGRTLDPALEPDRRFFSPRFISSYQSGAIRPAAPATAPAQ